MRIRRISIGSFGALRDREFEVEQEEEGVSVEEEDRLRDAGLRR